jgi:hypothetical protein
MRPVASPGRWVWGVSGLVTAVALAIPGTRLITGAGVPGNQYAQPQNTVTRTITVPQPVTSLNVQSYGAPVEVTAGSVRRVQVTETILYGPQGGRPPAVTPSVSGGRLTLADPACGVSGCSVSFRVTVPPDVTVTAATEGGPVTVSGTAGANLDSGGGPVRATGLDGPLTVRTGGGPLLLNGLTGPLYADTGGGPLLAEDVAAAKVTVITGGGEARIGFTAAPGTVTVSTDGGPAALAVPGGPYALTADSGGGPELVGIATDPAARRSITVTSGGGPLQVEPGHRPPAQPQTAQPQPAQPQPAQPQPAQPQPAQPQPAQPAAPSG